MPFDLSGRRSLFDSDQTTDMSKKENIEQEVTDHKEEDLTNELERLCLNSTIHGTFFLSESKSIWARVLWAAIILCSIATSGWVIRRSFANWESNPVVTSVAQIPIEDVPFPSITICPMSNTKYLLLMYDLVEAVVESAAISDAWRLQLLGHVLFAIGEWYEKDKLDVGYECLCKYSDKETCEEVLAFDAFKINLSVDELLLKTLFNSTNLSCPEWLSLYTLFKVMQINGSAGILSEVRVGRLLRFLLVNVEDDAESRELVVTELLDPKRFPDLYLGEGEKKLFFLDIFDAIMEKDDVNIANLSQLIDDNADDFFHKMRLSLHPPHISDPGVLRASFPYCFYPEPMASLNRSSNFCSHFQTTFNEEGLCYTYNSDDLGMSVSESAHCLRTVQGCGASKGLRLVMDGHRWSKNKLLVTRSSHLMRETSTRFTVFVSVPGVVTHKVPFVVDTSFKGEHSFYLHGLHYIVASEHFRKWNERSKVCYTPKDKKLSFFNHYAQDNCLLECRWKKIAARCQCWPWFLRRNPVCTRRGQRCFQELFRDYNEDHLDRVSCDCRGDCGGLHFFTSMSRSLFDEALNNAAFWFDQETKSGKLYDYLVHYNANNESYPKGGREEVEAEKRFAEDVAILNFFFDTPIITRITVEMKVTLFDQIASVGGTLGLFSGMSVITLAEIVYWLGRLIAAAAMKRRSSNSDVVYLHKWRPREHNKVQDSVNRSQSIKF